MAGHRKRIATLQALVVGTPALAPVANVVLPELSEVYSSRKVQHGNRKRLLQVLHSTRALDSSLSQFTSYHQCRGRARSLGQYLRCLVNHASPTLRYSLPDLLRRRYQAAIVDRRNDYMHRAGAFPMTDGEVAQLLSNMDDCLSIVVGLA
jgi:hypothetical protein